MPKNSMTDLTNHLFEQLERLNDEELSDEELARECNRAKAMEGIAKTIIDNRKLALDTAKFLDENGYTDGNDVADTVLALTGGGALNESKPVQCRLYETRKRLAVRTRIRYAAQIAHANVQ